MTELQLFHLNETFTNHKTYSLFYAVLDKILIWNALKVFLFKYRAKMPVKMLVDSCTIGYSLH